MLESELRLNFTCDNEEQNFTNLRMYATNEKNKDDATGLKRIIAESATALSIERKN
jgi:hypothetical protein